MCVAKENMSVWKRANILPRSTNNLINQSKNAGFVTLFLQENEWNSYK